MSAIQALGTSEITCHLVLNTARLLNKLSRKLGNKVMISWVRGHDGVDGNERADLLAKEGLASLAATPTW